MKKQFAFNVYNYRLIEDIVKWSKNLDVPVIIQTSVSYVQKVNIVLFGQYFQSVCEYYENSHAILHLDHCRDKDIIEYCYKNGWDSALFDGSHLSLEENIRNTIEAKEIAMKYGKLLEGEITPIYGEEDGIDTIYKGFTSVEQAKRFCAETEIDWFAPSVGTYHGIKEGESPEVQYSLLNDIYQATGVPLVLHGGSGLTQENFVQAFRSGVYKINISTELKRSFNETMSQYASKREMNPVLFEELLSKTTEQVIIPKLNLLRELK